MGQTDAAKALEGALGLALGGKDDERVLGVTLALHHPAALASDPEARAKLLEAIAADDCAFLLRLLQSSPALQRLALALLAVLLANSRAARRLAICLAPLVACCAEIKQADDTANVADAGVAGCGDGGDGSGADAPWGAAELLQALQVLRQALHLLGPGEAPASAAPAAEALIALLAPGGRLEPMVCVASVAEPALALVQELLAVASHDGAAPTLGQGLASRSFVLAACLKSELRGTEAHALALGLLAELLQGCGEESAWRPVHLDEALSEALAGGRATRQAALHLAGAAVSRLGLSFGKPGGAALLGRLRPLLSLMAGELRLGLEGHAGRDTTCAACAALEATIVAFGQESAALEESGNLEEVSDCLRQLHRAVGDVHDWCADLPEEGKPPMELALLARVAAAWQLEDPRRFETEFSRSLKAFCRLRPAEFAVLLPCVHELHDWHLTPALGQVLQIALVAQDEEARVPSAAEAWRQCALMLAEVSLDAAAYLPEAPLPEVPPQYLPTCADDIASSSADGPLAVGLPLPQATLAQVPRPPQAADAEHPGVVRLCTWSLALWNADAPGPDAQASRWELGVLCGALLVSVPPATLALVPGAAAAGCATWEAVADALFAGKAVDASTWRLALRLAGFALDRHRELAAALAARAALAAAAASGSGSRAGAAPKLQPPPGGEPAGDDDEDDEWAVVDASSRRVVEDFLQGLHRGGSLEGWAKYAVAAAKQRKDENAAKQQRKREQTKQPSAVVEVLTTEQPPCLDGMD